MCAAYSWLGIRTIAVNSSFLWADFADVLYAADSHWWRWMHDGIDYPKIGVNAEEVRRRYAAFRGQRCTIQSSGGNVADESVHMLKNKGDKGLSLDPEALVTGRNSGFQAMNLAVLAGAKRIVLLGFDGAPQHDGREHFHGPHPRPTPSAAYPLYRQAMSAAENPLIDSGIEVVNCSPGTQIDSFPKARLEDVL
jgi:hypothetical protein